MKERTFRQDHLLGIEHLSVDDIETILETAEAFIEVSSRDVKKVPALKGKTVVNLFFENSTRTRSSFEIAAKRLSADLINFNSSVSSLKKGETLKDTVLTLEAMNPHIIVIRHSASGCAALPDHLRPLLDHQRRRRLPRAPHPGPARRPDHPAAPQDPARAEDRHHRRHPALARGPLQHHPAPENRQRDRPGRPALAGAA